MLQEVWRGVPHVLLIALCVVVLHGLHLSDFEATEAHFRREAVQNLETGSAKDLAAGMIPMPSVRVLEVSSVMRVKQLEPSAADVTPRAIERLQGVRPLDRCKTAELLRQLATRLPTSADQRPKVVAIDFDLAPATGDSSGPCLDEMVDALNELRQKTAVVAILMSRLDGGDRLARNQFWTDRAACSRASASTSATAGSIAPLYLASPQVFHAQTGVPLDFPVGAEPDSDLVKAFGSVFPSVGNLIGLVLDGRSVSSAEGRALVALCEQMAASPAPACTLEDGLDARNAIDHADCLGQDLQPPRSDVGARSPTLNRVGKLRALAYNWPLLSREVTFMPLDALDQLSPGCEGMCLSADKLSAPVLVVAVDTGGGRDTYLVPNITPDPVSGAQLHALQHLSQWPGYRLHANSAQAVGIDMAAGVVFLVLWVGIKRRLDPLTGHMPGVFKGLKTLVPLLLVFGIDFVFRSWISPNLMDKGYWVNPIFVLTGLLLHAYADASHGDGHRGSSPPADFSFGAARVAATPRGPGTVTVQADAWLMALVQWGVIVTAGVFLTRGGAVHRGPELALALVVSMIILIPLHWRSLTRHHQIQAKVRMKGH